MHAEIKNKTSKVIMLTEIIELLLRETMKGQRGSVYYFTPRKINTFLLLHNIRIYPGHFNIIYDVLRCIAGKIGGEDLTIKRRTDTTSKSKPIIAIPTSIINYDIHELVVECIGEVSYG